MFRAGKDSKRLRFGCLESGHLHRRIANSSAEAFPRFPTVNDSELDCADSASVAKSSNQIRWNERLECFSCLASFNPEALILLVHSSEINLLGMVLSSVPDSSDAHAFVEQVCFNFWNLIFLRVCAFQCFMLGSAKSRVVKDVCREMLKRCAAFLL